MFAFIGVLKKYMQTPTKGNRRFSPAYFHSFFRFMTSEADVFND
jgi:hypothetical protein